MFLPFVIRCLREIDQGVYWMDSGTWEPGPRKDVVPKPNVCRGEAEGPPYFCLLPLFLFRMPLTCHLSDQLCLSSDHVIHEVTERFRLYPLVQGTILIGYLRISFPNTEQKFD